MTDQHDEPDSLPTKMRHMGVMLEHIIDQQQSILEIMGGMRENLKTLAKQEDLDEVKSDIKVIKAAVTHTNREVRSLDHRVTRLEAAA